MRVRESDVVQSPYYHYLKNDEKNLPPSATPQGVATDDSVNGVMEAVFALASATYKKRVVKNVSLRKGISKKKG
jgi:hypothetical protein